jgi:2-amino-4-hydroxy-6-hydroxymethyldihydropteridine diphosphokinase
VSAEVSLQLNPTLSHTLCYLGLGGNLGHPMALFDEVIDYFRAHSCAKAVRESLRFESAPVDATGPNYVNSVLELMWQGNAEQLLHTCMAIESQLGRVRTTRNAPRPIDVDVLLFGQQTVNTSQLTVPHPRMHLRRFVLDPLLLLNPEIEIPGLGPAKNHLPGTLDQIVKAI